MKKIKENIGTIIYVIIGSTLILLLLFSIFNCCASSAREEEKCIQERNIPLEESSIITGSNIYIDPETGVNYIHFLKGGVCVRVNEDGTPYVTDVTDISKLKNEEHK